MADSVREKIMARLATVLAATAGVSGRVYRSQADALAFSKAPCITLDWRTDEPAPDGTILMHRKLSAIVTIYTRGDLPDALADPIAQSVHTLIMADAQLAGNAIDTTLGSAGFMFESADKTGGRLAHEYLILYRHSHGDLTQ